MLDKQLAEFLEEGLAIHIGTRNASLEPNAARVTAVKVDPEAALLEVFVPVAAAAALIADLEANGQAAIVVARPTDERGCQVKGVFTGWRDAAADEQPWVLAQWTRFRDILAQVGVPHLASSAWAAWPAVVIGVRVTSIFNQTPGPGAGAPLT